MLRRLLFALLFTTVPALAAESVRLERDTPGTTVAGTAFVAPAGWSQHRRGDAIVLEAPEAGSWIALIDVDAKDASDAAAKAWSVVDPAMQRERTTSTPLGDKDGWREQRVFAYATSPDERRSVSARVMRHGERWSVRLADLANAVSGKREAQIALVYEELLPKGYVRETFAGRRAHALDATRLATLDTFVEQARTTLEVPGVSVGVVQNGKVVFARGFGVREHGKPAKVDADTLYLIASNTKSLTTLMLGKLVDEGVLTWDTPVRQVLPAFRLADADTADKVLVRHLLCACTGLPRHDLEWILGPADATPALTLDILGRMTPTSKFGEMYQYSNPIAAAAGLVGGHAVYPSLELGAAYDKVMATRVFKPLRMKRTTLDFDRATRGNYARPYAFDVDGRLALVDMAQNTPIRNVRPAGGSWSNVNDLLRYVQMELAQGVLPNGRRYISADVLEARQAEQVRTGKHSWYGMGLDVDMRWGTPMVYHGGRLRGYRTNMAWFPEHGVGVVVLTNADNGNVLMDALPRRVAELMLDGEPEAQSAVTAAAETAKNAFAARRRALTLPADATALATLASRYRNDVLGTIAVTTLDDGRRAFDFGAWRAPLASRRNPDGSTTFVAAAAGWSPELLAGTREGKRTLTIRDQQHEYVFVEGD